MTFQEFSMVLMKLRLGLSDYNLVDWLITTCNVTERFEAWFRFSSDKMELFCLFAHKRFHQAKHALHFEDVEI